MDRVWFCELVHCPLPRPCVPLVPIAPFCCTPKRYCAWVPVPCWQVCFTQFCPSCRHGPWLDAAAVPFPPNPAAITDAGTRTSAIIAQIRIFFNMVVFSIECRHCDGAWSIICRSCIIRHPGVINHFSDLQLHIAVSRVNRRKEEYLPYSMGVYNSSLLHS